MGKLDAAVLGALADKVLTPQRLKEMLRELRARLRAAHAGRDGLVRGLQRELTELELATSWLYEAVEKGILPMNDTLSDSAQKLKGRRYAILLEIAGAKRAKEVPLAAITGAQIDAFSTALRSRLLEGGSGIAKRYLRQFVGEVRFDGKRLSMRGRKASLLSAVAEREMGTARVPTSSQSWLPVLALNQGPTV
jgi:site-specific DNA recombinase